MFLFMGSSASRSRLQEQTGSRTVEEPLQQQYASIYSVPFLAEGEQEELHERIAAGDEEARKRLIAAYLPYATARARRRGKGDPHHIQDLIQESSLAVLRQVDAFDQSRGNKLITPLRKTVPRSITKANQRHKKHIGRNDPSGNNAYRVTSLDETFDDEDDPRSAFMKDAKTETPDVIAGDAEVRERIQDMLSKLSYRERFVIHGLFGIGEEKREGAQIATELNVSRPFVYVLRDQALEKIRELMERGFKPDRRRTEAVRSTDRKAKRFQRSLAVHVWRNASEAIRRKSGMDPSDDKIAASLGICIDALPGNHPERKLQVRLDMLYLRILDILKDVLRPSQEEIIRKRYCLNGNPERLAEKEIADQRKTTHYTVSWLRAKALSVLRRTLNPEEQDHRLRAARRTCTAMIWKKARATIRATGEAASEERIARYFGLPPSDGDEGDAQLHTCRLDTLAERADSFLASSQLDERKRHILERRFCFGSVRIPTSECLLAEEEGCSATNIQAHKEKAILALSISLSPEERINVQLALADDVRNAMDTSRIQKKNGGRGRRRCAVTNPAEREQLTSLLQRIELILNEALSERQTAIIRERFCLGHHVLQTPYEELAKRFKVNVPTAREYCHRAIRMLARTLTRQECAASDGMRAPAERPSPPPGNITSGAPENASYTAAGMY
jgi:RNA polymerase sigma factor (sigma-70 family)